MVDGFEGVRDCRSLKLRLSRLPVSGWWNSRLDRDKCRELAQVLGCSCEVEIVFYAILSSYAQAVELQDAFEMGEQHFDLFRSRRAVGWHGPSGAGRDACRRDRHRDRSGGHSGYGALKAVGAAAHMVEDGDVRLDAALMDQPGKISRIAIAGIGS